MLYQKLFKFDKSWIIRYVQMLRLSAFVDSFFCNFATNFIFK